MKCFEIDLYDYYKVKKPEGGKGILHAYIRDNSVEIDINRKNPAMLVIPGGGYCFCSFREEEPIALSYLGNGFTAFYLDYSVAPIRYPYSLTEAVMAMNYIRENADSLNVDKDKISAVGFSAGGHLCALLGSNYDSEDVKKLFLGKECAKPNAVILSYPVITSTKPTHFDSFLSLCGDDEKLYEKLDIVNCINKNSAPAFIWSTYDDGCVPIRNSLLVAEAYEKAGVKFAVHIWGKGYHGSATSNEIVYPNKDFKPFFSDSLPRWVELSIEWLKELGLYI